MINDLRILWRELFTVAIVILMIIGCRSTPQKAGNVAGTIAEPVPESPKLPDIQPLQRNVVSATTHTTNTQTQIKTAKTAVDAGNAPAAVLPLNSASDEVLKSLSDLLAVTNQLGQLQKQNESDHKEWESIKKTDQDNYDALKTAADKDAKTNADSIAGLESDIKTLKDSTLNKVKLCLGIAAFALFMGMAAAIAAGLFAGFRQAVWVAPGLGLMAAICITVAVMLTEIIWWTIALVLTGIVISVAFAIWHAFHHVPVAARVPATVPLPEPAK